MPEGKEKTGESIGENDSQARLDDLKQEVIMFVSANGAAQTIPPSDVNLDDSNLDEAIRKAQQRKELPPVNYPPSPEVSEVPQPIDPGRLNQSPNLVNPTPSISNSSIFDDPKYLEKTFPDIQNSIIARLNEIETKNFPAGTQGGRFLEQLGGSKILRDMKRAVLYKAVVENWSEETLYDEFEKAIADLHTKAASGQWGSTLWLWGRTGWTKLWGEGNPTLGGENPHIKNRIIKKSDKSMIIQRFTSIEAEVKKDTVSEYWDPDAGTIIEGEYDEDHVDTDQLDFVEDIAIPFYREYYANRAIMENASSDQIAKDYKKKIEGLFNSSIR